MTPLLLAIVLAQPCAPTRFASGSIDAWRAALRRAPAEKYDEHLARLKLAPAQRPEYQPLRLDRIDVFPARLSEDEPIDRVVQVKFTTRFTEAFVAEHSRESLSQEVWVYRIVVLRPRGPNAWCVVGFLDADVPADEHNARARDVRLRSPHAR